MSPSGYPSARFRPRRAGNDQSLPGAASGIQRVAQMDHGFDKRCEGFKTFLICFVLVPTFCGRALAGIFDDRDFFEPKGQSACGERTGPGQGHSYNDACKKRRPNGANSACGSTPRGHAGNIQPTRIFVPGRWSRGCVRRWRGPTPGESRGLGERFIRRSPAEVVCSSIRRLLPIDPSPCGVAHALLRI